MRTLKKILPLIVALLSSGHASESAEQSKQENNRRMMRWAHQEKILGGEDLRKNALLNVLPKELFASPTKLHYFLDKYAIGSKALLFSHGVNSASYHVYRLSPSRLLICFTTMQPSKGSEKLDTEILIRCSVVGREENNIIRKSLVPFPNINYYTGKLGPDRGHTENFPKK